MPHLVAFSLMVLCILVGELAKGHRIFFFLCLSIFATNIPTLSYWYNPNEKHIPFSWWIPTSREILDPRPEAWSTAMEIIGQDPSIIPGGFETLAVIPQWLSEVGIFYLGNKLIITPNLDPGSVGEKRVQLHIGDKAFAVFRKAPRWVIYESPQAPAMVAGYERIQLSTHRERPDDGTRPELTRHTFYNEVPTGDISLYRRIH